MTTHRMSAVIIAVLIPFMEILLTFCMVVAWIEKMFKRIPTLKLGARYKDVILPNGVRLGPVWIHSKSWGYVNLVEMEGGETKPGLIRMLKRDLKRCTCIEVIKDQLK